MLDSDILLVGKQYKKIVVVGASFVGKRLVELFSREDAEILVCDNSAKMQGTQERYTVVPVEEAIVEGAAYLVSSESYFETLKQQLVDLGVPENNIFMAVTDESKEALFECKAKKKLTPLNKLQFEIDITAHCNLNCKCCSQFSCIADEEFLDIDQMERDFKRLGQLFSGQCERIYLIGGEPLLHPRIIDAMKVARRHFPEGKISVFTNGLLLLKQPDEFWESCRENKIGIIVTKYPIQLEHEAIQSKAKEQDVDFEFFGRSEDFKYMMNLGLDPEGKQDVYKSYVNCVEANNCIKLKDGKLFTCTRPAAIYKFNKYFNKNLQVCDCDYVDIYQVNSGEEVLERLAKPIEFCKYCKTCVGDRKAFEWGKTSGEIEEWL